MTGRYQDRDQLLITFDDIRQIFQRHFKKLIACICALGVLGVLYALFQPHRYQAEATFREKGKKSTQLNANSSIMQLLGSDFGGSQENEATQMFQTRKLLMEVISKLNLQASLQPEGSSQGLFSRLKSNSKLLWASFTQNRHPVLRDPSDPLKVAYLHYDGEVPLDYVIAFLDDQNFEVLKNRIALGTGSLDIPYVHEDLTFVLSSEALFTPSISFRSPASGSSAALFSSAIAKAIPSSQNPTSDPSRLTEILLEGVNKASNENEKVESQKFHLHIEPMEDVVKQLAKSIVIEPTKADKGVLKLTFHHVNRHQASRILNTLMDVYQNYLQSYHAKIFQLQLNYLHKRQSHLAANLELLMNRHAKFLSEDLFNSGFVNSDKEMDFLARNQHQYKERLLSNGLEIKRLESLQSNIYVYYDHYPHGEGDSTVINEVLHQIREFKQRRDGLEIEIQKKAQKNSHEVQHSFDRQLEELKRVQTYIAQLHDISDRFHQNMEPNEGTELFNDPRFLIKGWFERLHAQTIPQELQGARENFQFYLSNLERLFNVHEKILQERLTHQQNVLGEYQGVDIKTANELYVEYSKQLIALESSIRQNLFFIEQMEDPQFELTSLSSVLGDPVSQDMIRKASHLVLTLRDQNNQSQREQERLKEELSLQRTFLSLHLKQSVQLMELNKQLIDEKIYALQNITIELIHRQISLLENTLKDYLESRLENLRQERVLIKEHLKQIRGEMTSLPKKWMAEKLIQHEVDSNHLIVEEIAKMVESRNISHNLEVIQSEPIDLSIPPVHPLPPRVFFYGFLGFILGGLFGSGVILGRSIWQGIRASPANLKQLGLFVAGVLKGNSEDLDALRRMQAYLETSNEHSNVDQVSRKGKLLLLAEGCGPDYADQLCDLFLKRDQKVVRLSLDFVSTELESGVGLLGYLEGRHSFPNIQTTPHGDQIDAGGATPFGPELLNSPAFIRLLEHLQQRYDWVIGVMHATATSVEVQSLLPHFPHVVFTLTHETVEEIAPYAELVQDPAKKWVFVFVGQA